MRAEQIMDALGDLDLALLEECEAYTAERVKRRRQLRYAASGLCAVLVMGLGIRMLPIFARMTTDSAAVEHAKDEAEISVTITQSTQAETGVKDDDLYGSTKDAVDFVEESYGGVGAPSEPVDDVLRDECAEEEMVEDVPAEEAPIEAPAADASEETFVVDQYSDKILSETESVTELPMLSVSVGDGGYGFEGILLYEEDVRCSVNLLDTYGTPETLPVYRNLAFYDMSGKPVYLSDAEMLAIGSDYAESLGFEVLSYETADPWEDEDIEDYVILQTTGGELRVDGSGNAVIEFASPVPIPADLSLDRDTDADTAEKTAAYLTEQYQALLSDAEYEVITTVSRTFTGEQHRSVYIYPIGETAGETYVNRDFSEVTFYSGGDAENTLGMIQIANRRLSAEEIGQYPLIDETAATEMLAAGEYITTVPAEYLGADSITEDMILSCELEYRLSNLDTYFIPYYHFYVRLDGFPKNHAEGLTNYGGYWVPAVHPDYLGFDIGCEMPFN